MTHRPNIIFVQCDSMDGRLMGCMGHPAMARATPNLDALTRGGVVFRNAYASHPICCPSRANMWSGLHTHHCEAWNNYKGLSETDPTFRTRLDQAGYLTHAFGKTDYLSGGHSIRARVSAWTRTANIQRPGYRMRPPLILGSEDELRFHHRRDLDNVRASIDWLKEAARLQERPFFLYLGIGAPHPAFTTCRALMDKIDPAGVAVPPPDTEDHPVMQYQRLHKNWEHGFSDDMVRLVRHVYFAMIALVDEMVGSVVSAMDDLGLAETTYLVFASDHGELAMEHRQTRKQSLYEASTRVPLIIIGPDVAKGLEVETLASLVDIYPTLMDMAGLEQSEGMGGYSLMPELGQRPGEHPDWVLSQFHGSTCRTGAFMLRRGAWKYNAYVGFEPQLFNLREDPDEVHNMARDRLDVTQEMDALLRQIVDYEEVDARAKAYDRRSFAAWRQEQLIAGTYEQTMARVYSGWDDLSSDGIQPWREDDEGLIVQWLAGDEGLAA